jgi:pilus assembly protein Flp/PilA
MSYLSCSTKHSISEGESEMKNFFQTIRNLHTDESGQDLIEYALVAALIALGATTAMSGLSTAINGAFVAITNALKAA